MFATTEYDITKTHSGLPAPLDWNVIDRREDGLMWERLVGQPIKVIESVRTEADGRRARCPPTTISRLRASTSLAKRANVIWSFRRKAATSTSTRFCISGCAWMRPMGCCRTSKR